MDAFVQVLLDLSQNLGYGGIIFLMTVESTFIPFPSELVIPPAAYLAYKGEMNIFLVVLCGVAGSVFGAIINYMLAKWLGRPLIHRLARQPWARFLFLNEEKLKNAENYFLKHGNISTFIGRLVFGVRHLISFPAGFAKMPLGAFVFFTMIGSAFWVSILATSGYFIGGNEVLIKKYLVEISIGLLILIVATILIYYFWKKNHTDSISN